MPATNGEILSALAGVEEPELERSIVELGMVAGVAVDGRSCVVALALPLPGEATRIELTRRIVRGGGLGRRCQPGRRRRAGDDRRRAQGPSRRC